MLNWITAPFRSTPAPTTQPVNASDEKTPADIIVHFAPDSPERTQNHDSYKIPASRFASDKIPVDSFATKENDKVFISIASPHNSATESRHSDKIPVDAFASEKSPVTLAELEGASPGKNATSVHGIVDNGLHLAPTHTAPEPLEQGVQSGVKLAKSLLEKATARFSVGIKNMAYLTSEQCQKSKIGRIASRLDLPFFLLGFVPLLHFLWLLQPSTLLFAAGALFNKRIGHEFLPKGFH